MTTAVPIVRDPAEVDGRDFDIVIVGAGIYGALCAVEAAHRGLRTLLFDRGDFGAGASFRSLRTIHGGLRYLQSLDIARARASSRQRDWWLRTFPDLVVPRPCLMPLYGRGWRRPAAFRAAAVLARLLRLNSPGLAPECRLPALRLVDAAEVQRRFPGIPAGGLKAGALWHEAFMTDSPRIVVECIRWAVAAGAQALNYVELASAQPERAGSSRLTLIDHASGLNLTLTARAIVNATGSAVDRVAQRLGGRNRPLMLPTIAWNLLLDARLPGDCCLALTPPRRGAQTYFLQPFRGRILAGTGHAAAPAGDGELAPSATMIDAMRADLEVCYESAALGRSRVVRILAEALPGRRAGDRQLALRPRVVRDSVGAGALLVHVVGVKFTEAPDVAVRALDMVGAGSRAVLRPRPQAADGWDVLDRIESVSREALLELAARESVLCLEDLLERRTNAWCSDYARQRVTALVGGSLAGTPPGQGRVETLFRDNPI